ncbi:MAG: DUF5305 domain-containing protein [Mollicutes bacterium]|nr:DUF5305 domain-containing protein [Mollicutes bacterium]
MNKKDKTIIILIILVITFLSFFFFFNAFKIIKYKQGNPKDIIYTSKVEDNLLYQVILKPNDYIDNNEINNNLSYITSLVEYTDITFIYDYLGSEDVSLNYNYTIKANIVSEYNDKGESALKPVWNKEFILLEPQYGNTPNSKINISEKLKIGLKFYNDLVTQFSKDLDLPITSTLEIKLIVDISGKLENNKPLNKEHYMLMSIPLNVKAFDITTSKNFMEEEIIYSKEHLKTETIYMLAILYLCLGMGTIYLGIAFIKIIRNKNKDKYTIEKEKILKEYDDRIVIVKNFIKYSSYDIIDIISFDELMNLSNEAYEPIIFWERKEKGHKEAWFTIIKNKIIYRYLFSKK